MGSSTRGATVSKAPCSPEVSWARFSHPIVRHWPEGVRYATLAGVLLVDMEVLLLSRVLPPVHALKHRFVYVSRSVGSIVSRPCADSPAGDRYHRAELTKLGVSEPTSQ